MVLLRMVNGSKDLVTSMRGDWCMVLVTDHGDEVDMSMGEGLAGRRVVVLGIW